MVNYIYYKEKFGERLKQLSNELVDRKKIERKQKNAEVDKENRQNKEKSRIDKSFLYRHKDRLHAYTRHEMINEISTIYGETIEYQAFNLYINGERFPDLNLVKLLADYFKVSFEYMCGMTDIPNELNSKIKEIIHLSEDAIITLISYNKNTTAQYVMNGLLADAESSSFLFMNMVERMYQTFKRSKSLGKTGEYDQSVILQNFINAEAFNKYLEKHLLPLVSDSFEKRLIIENEEERWKTEHYVEYEQEILEAIDQANGNQDIIIKKIEVTKVDQSE
jgi:hypothetical protein